MHSTNSTSASPYAAEAPTAAAVAVATTAAKAAAVATAAAKASEQSAAATEADQTSAAEAATACSSLVISPRLTRVLKKIKAVSTAHLVNINEVHRFTFGTGESLRIAFGVTKSLLFAFGNAYQLHCGFAVGIQCAATDKIFFFKFYKNFKITSFLMRKWQKNENKTRLLQRPKKANYWATAAV
jgi:hypothetical protein